MDGTWKLKNGDVIQITDMSDRHIFNAIKGLMRKTIYSMNMLYDTEQSLDDLIAEKRKRKEAA